ncbi:MAG: DnaA regulatory inactivator Hda [Burkholderiales bacterium PBB1]|nr:MAG: DnaA regulatory inactivator Hda [Burkholderiales bacterium PBB1]
MKQIPLPISLGSQPTFDSFVAGPNAMTLAQLRAACAPGAAATPLYLWGEQGAGKTHLLRALAHEVQKQGGRVGWFDASQPLPWLHDDSWSLLVLDGCESYGAQQQHAAFALFVEATAQATLIAASGRLPPVDLPLRDDLRSRLGWGHVMTVQPLSEAESRAALRREADQRGLFLSDEVIDHLLHRYARDLKHLMTQLDRLDEFALVHKRALTVPLLRQMLAETAADDACSRNGVLS